MIDDLGAVALWGSYAVIWTLIGLSVISFSLIVERVVWFMRRREDLDALTGDLLALTAQGDLDSAYALVSARRSIEAQVIVDVLPWYDAGPAALGQAMQASVRSHRKALYGGLNFLGTLGNNAPFIGLFGTVLGVITAFQQMGVDALGSMDNVMSGIGEALVATAVGILVALPAVAAHNALQGKALRVEENIARVGHLLMAQLERVAHHDRATSSESEAN
ncbi:MAG: biopolymer transport protein ExbB/TolQ [Bradymonadia bacterium]|jgi:biopolymer transport protein ExbB/TolQ